MRTNLGWLLALCLFLPSCVSTLYKGPIVTDVRYAADGHGIIVQTCTMEVTKNLWAYNADFEDCGSTTRRLPVPAAAAP